MLALHNPSEEESYYSSHVYLEPYSAISLHSQIISVPPPSTKNELTQFDTPNLQPTQSEMEISDSSPPEMEIPDFQSELEITEISDPPNDCPSSDFPSNNESGNDFNVGDTFHTYKELQAKVKLYEASHSVQLSHRDSRTLEAARKRAPQRVAEANTDLIYYTISLVCIFGGKKYRNMGTGERACQRYIGIARSVYLRFHLVLMTDYYFVLCYDKSCIFSSTIKQGCTAGIKFSLTGDGQRLVVTAVNENHNHELNKVIHP